MFAPTFDPAPFQNAIDLIESNRWLVDNMLIMPRHEAHIHRNVRVARASATTRIEGATLDEADVNALIKKGRPGKLTDDEQINLNAVQAYEFVDYLSDQSDIPINELVIREMNRVFLRNMPETLTPGVYRKGQNKVGTTYDPPDQGSVPALMRDFATWLESDEEIHPIFKAGIAHIHLVAIHPFWDGNGRTARALTTLILQRSPGFAFKKLLSLEAFTLAIRTQYLDAIEKALGSSYSSDYNLVAWLDFFTYSLSAHTVALTQELTDWHRKMEGVYAAMEKLDINHRQADALAFAVQTGQITRADYLDITGISPVTASRELKRLVESGFLNAEGKTRSRIYRFALEQPGLESAPTPEQMRLFDANEKGVSKKAK